jgi:hypothetical protein
MYQIARSELRKKREKSDRMRLVGIYKRSETAGISR